MSTLPKSLPPRGFAEPPFGPAMLPIAGSIELDDRLLPTPGLTMSGRPEAHLRHTQAPCQGLVRTGGKSNGRELDRPGPASRSRTARQEVACLCQLPIDQPAVGVGALRHSQRPWLQGLSRSVRAHGGGTTGALPGRGARCQRVCHSRVVRRLSELGMVHAGVLDAGNETEQEAGLPLCDRTDRRLGDHGSGPEQAVG